MNHVDKLRALTLITLLLLLAGCVALPAPVAPTPTPEDAPLPTRSEDRLVIYAPATPSSLPVIIAARRIEGAEVTIFTNHSQASTLFLRGDVDILVTGLSVGIEFFKNGVPVQAVNSNVSGLTYLVTYGKQVGSFAELMGGEIYIPFEGSPIEETTQYLAQQEGLTWKEDLKPIYSPFAASVELLKQGKAAAVALPEPFVTQVEAQPGVFVSFGYKAKWDALAGNRDGYPQVAAFVNKDWAGTHTDMIAAFNTELAAALRLIQDDPAAAVAQAQDALGFPPQVLAVSLRRTDFALTTGADLAQQVRSYYRTIGKPLDETFDAFFYGAR